MFVRITEIDGVPTVLEVIDFDPSEHFTSEIAALFSPQEPGAVYMAQKINGKWVAPETVAPLPEPVPDPEPTYRLQIAPAEFRNMFTAFEEVDIKAFVAGGKDDDPADTKRARAVVGVLFDRLLDPRLTFVDLGVPENIRGLAFLRDLGLITPDRYATIAKGLPEATS